MIDELKKLRELTETLTGNGYLMDQAEEWEYVLDAVPDCVYIIDTSCKIKFVNRLLSERLGKNKQEFYNKLCDEEIDPITGECCNGVYSEHELNKLIRMDGVYLSNMEGWFNITRSPITTRDGNLIGFICILQDVTEKSRALTKLQESEQKYRLIAENLPEIVWTFDTNMSFTFVTPLVEEIMGYKPEEWIGHSFSEFVDPKDSKLMVDGILKALEDPSFKGITFKAKMLSKTNKVVLVEIDARPIYVNGIFLGFQGRTRVLK
jgi:PAS domain S-box-containing protein